MLTITGSDGTGGAGIQQDIKTITALGGIALSAITTVTMQNTLGIQEFYDLPATVLKHQLQAILEDMHPTAVKVGMVRSREQMEIITDCIKTYQLQNIVYGPVMQTADGQQLLPPSGFPEAEQQLLSLCTVVTSRLKVRSLVNWDTHGMKGIFSTAIATLLARGLTREDAIREATDYINHQAAMESQLMGRGSSLYNELLQLIARHHQKRNDVQFYADQMNVSTRYLAQITRRLARVTPKQLIDQQLTEALRQALRRDDRSIQEVAYAYGFASASHFTKYFKKQTGQTPTQFRQALA